MTVDEMREQREIAPVAFIQFDRRYSKDKNRIYCFVEGEDDDKYYQPRMDEHCSLNSSFIVCNGKYRLLRIHSIISQRKEYNAAVTAFFVDSDFDEKLGNSEIYETPCYSFENLYTSEECFKRIIERQFGEDGTGHNHILILDNLIRLQNEFHKVIMEFNAWVKLQRRYEHENKHKRRLNLDRVKDYKLYDVSFEKVEKKYNIEIIEDCCKEFYKVSTNEIEMQIKEFDKCSLQKIFRGKNEFVFLCKALSILSEKYNRCKSGKDSYFVKADNMRTVRLNIDACHMYSILSSYAETPECLIKYIHSRHTAA